MWNRYGLKQPVKINLVETKQIIPDKNLFGQSNLAANAFNVIIQLATAPARVRGLSRRGRRSRWKSQSNKVANIVQDHAYADNAIGIQTPCSSDIDDMIRSGRLHVASMSDINSKSIGDINIPDKTNGEADEGESDYENENATNTSGEVVGPMNDMLDTNALAIAVATRKEGHNTHTE